MKIIPKKGVENILFGMKCKDVESILGKPSKMLDDEDANKIYLYNQHKLALTFYEDEGFRLGYITIADTATSLFGHKIMACNVADAKKNLADVQKWEFEDFDTFEHHFNEENWLILVVEFNEIVKIEIGALIVNDQFVWAFKSS